MLELSQIGLFLGGIAAMLALGWQIYVHISEKNTNKESNLPRG